MYKIEKGQNSSLNDYQKIFIEENYSKMSDKELAEHLLVTKNQVNYFRRDVLKLFKSVGNKKKHEVYLTPSGEIVKEINAIQNYANFPSFMNGAKDRVKYLESVLNNVRH